jgi:hypothetical protein
MQQSSPPLTTYHMQQRVMASERCLCLSSDTDTCHNAAHVIEAGCRLETCRVSAKRCQSKMLHLQMNKRRPRHYRLGPCLIWTQRRHGGQRAAVRARPHGGRGRVGCP